MQKKYVTASLIRRLLAIFYDLLLLLGVLFAVSACAVALNKGESVSHPAYYLALIVTTFLFFGGFWTHGGQTLGMRTWKIKIISDNGNKVTWRQAAMRFCAAVVALIPIGIGFLWMLIDSERLAWHDRWSTTRLISLKVSKKDTQASAEDALT